MWWVQTKGNYVLYIKNASNLKSLSCLSIVECEHIYLQIKQFSEFYITYNENQIQPECGNFYCQAPTIMIDISLHSLAFLQEAHFIDKDVEDLIQSFYRLTVFDGRG